MNPALEKRFEQLLQKHKGIIYKVARSYCYEADERKDLMQEMVIQLWRSFGRYNDEHKFSTWMYRVVLNVAISYVRKEMRRKSRTSKIDDSILNVSDETASGEAEERFGQLHRFIVQLDELNKALIILYLEEYTYKEIATVMGITETNVATKISRIKERIRIQYAQIKK